jgi:cyanophycin synthetase
VLEHIPRNEQGKLIRPQLTHDIAQKLRVRSKTTDMDAALSQDKRGVTAVHTFMQQPILDPTQLPTRQPMRQFKINLSCPAPIDLDSIDDWFKSALAIEIDPCNCSIAQAQHSSRTPMAGLIWRILLLIRSLLQSARIPAFHPGRVLGIDQDKKNSSDWTATVAVVKIDHIPPRCYAITIDEAIKIVLWAMGRARTPENVASLYSTIQKQVIHPLRKMIIAGKSTIPVLRVAYQQNIPFSHLGAGVYQLGWGGKSRRMDRSTTELDSAIGSKLAQNKVWSANLIRMAGLPAPEHGVVTTKEEASRVARHLGWPVVVKPVNRDRGEGVTVGVTDENQLLAAFKMAKAKQVIIEREVVGVCHRLFIANEQLLYAVKRLPKSIKGDGRRTVAELIRESNQVEKNKPPWLRSELYPSDSLAIEALTNAGFAFDSVPPEGELVPLRKIESTQWGGFDEDVADCIHPDNLDIALRAAALFGLNVAGIDIISPDIRKPWHENGAIINEVNFAPLFGGGEISRHHIPIFFKRFMNGDGRIPVEAFMGGDAAMDMARERQKELISQGIKCVLTSHKTTLAISGEETHFLFQSLFKRCKALLMNGQVEAIGLAIQTDEFLHTGLPIDRIDRITTTAGELTAWNRPDVKLPQSRVESLLALLRNHEK